MQVSKCEQCKKCDFCGNNMDGFSRVKNNFQIRKKMLKKICFFLRMFFQQIKQIRCIFFFDNEFFSQNKVALSITFFCKRHHEAKIGNLIQLFQISSIYLITKRSKYQQTIITFLITLKMFLFLTRWKISIVVRFGAFVCVCMWVGERVSVRAYLYMLLLL
eukprot:TRINITY_DN5940_c0_g1_i1.p4 TRINITY_DN5940_c0_g1~~TRINITY_DN5940_c0_g1_i1.p4  ORF type:complete len:161 (+),score=7.96 TRINITY_DN5940_c0_g1_i1:872-1354(+)